MSSSSRSGREIRRRGGERVEVRAESTGRGGWMTWMEGRCGPGGARRPRAAAAARRTRAMFAGAWRAAADQPRVEEGGRDRRRPVASMSSTSIFSRGGASSTTSRNGVARTTRRRVVRGHPTGVSRVASLAPSSGDGGARRYRSVARCDTVGSPYVAAIDAWKHAVSEPAATVGCGEGRREDGDRELVLAGWIELTAGDAAGSRRLRKFGLITGAGGGTARAGGGGNSGGGPFAFVFGAGGENVAATSAPASATSAANFSSVSSSSSLAAATAAADRAAVHVGPSVAAAARARVATGRRGGRSRKGRRLGGGGGDDMDVGAQETGTDGTAVEDDDDDDDDVEERYGKMWEELQGMSSRKQNLPSRTTTTRTTKYLSGNIRLKAKATTGTTTSTTPPLSPPGCHRLRRRRRRHTIMKLHQAQTNHRDHERGV